MIQSAQLELDFLMVCRYSLSRIGPQRGQCPGIESDHNYYIDIYQENTFLPLCWVEKSICLQLLSEEQVFQAIE